MELPALHGRLEQLNMVAYESYRPRPHDGAAVFVRASTRDRHQCDPLPVWSHVLAHRRRAERIHGGHFDMMSEPNVSAVAEVEAAYY